MECLYEALEQDIKAVWVVRYRFSRILAQKCLRSSALNVVHVSFLALNFDLDPCKHVTVGKNVVSLFRFSRMVCSAFRMRVSQSLK